MNHPLVDKWKEDILNEPPTMKERMLQALIWIEDYQNNPTDHSNWNKFMNELYSIYFDMKE